MTDVFCMNIDCKWCEDGYCQKDVIQISYDFECDDREERDDEDEEDE